MGNPGASALPGASGGTAGSNVPMWSGAASQACAPHGGGACVPWLCGGAHSRGSLEKDGRNKDSVGDVGEEAEGTDWRWARSGGCSGWKLTQAARGDGLVRSGFGDASDWDRAERPCTEPVRGPRSSSLTALSARSTQRLALGLMRLRAQGSWSEQRAEDALAGSLAGGQWGHLGTDTTGLIVLVADTIAEPGRDNKRTSRGLT
ncbi:hypothetical protein CYMTET_27938 [Cymbomonas tetramitiformis]|uniref:Uncharacterized protein n=1 Tax=Cymbomonas tetramitiformis TaxID=36881 RepID=A0AAE0FPD0_9CHLO|nr:hypothetical protein CYMTET_27938 [Cymbomonas tetramitiformis]